MLRFLAIPLTTALVVAIAGCGEVKIDSGKAEDLAKKVANSGRVKLTSVSCPDDIKAKKGADFDCDLVYADGAKGTITIHQTNDGGGVQTAGTDVHVTGP